MYVHHFCLTIHCDCPELRVICIDSLYRNVGCPLWLLITDTRWLFRGNQSTPFSHRNSPERPPRSLPYPSESTIQYIKLAMRTALESHAGQEGKRKCNHYLFCFHWKHKLPLIISRSKNCPQAIISTQPMSNA